MEYLRIVCAEAALAPTKSGGVCTTAVKDRFYDEGFMMGRKLHPSCQRLRGRGCLRQYTEALALSS